MPGRWWRAGGGRKGVVGRGGRQGVGGMKR